VRRGGRKKIGILSPAPRGEGEEEGENQNFKSSSLGRGI